MTSAADYLTEAERHASTALTGPEPDRPVEASLALAYATMAVAAATLETKTPRRAPRSTP